MKNHRKEASLKVENHFYHEYFLQHFECWEKRIPEKIMFGIEIGNIVSSSCVICSSNTGKYSGKKTEIDLYIFLKSSTVFLSNVTFEKILSLQSSL